MEYKLIAQTDGRIRGEDWVKFDYKKGKQITLENENLVRFYSISGWSLLEKADASTKEVVKAETVKRNTKEIIYLLAKSKWTENM